MTPPPPAPRPTLTRGSSRRFALLSPRAVLLAAALMGSVAPGAAAPPGPPDLTKGETTGVDRNGTYNLGATGLRGWIYLKPATHFDGLQGRTTAPSRQILVTHVGAKSPADGVMQVDDVILGIGGKLFADDARRSLSQAIQEAEKDANQGILKLTRWRAGKTDVAQLKLRVMGTYSATAPFNCPKSQRIFNDACKVLENEPLPEDWSGAITGLALLATGNPDYLPKLQVFARKMGPPQLHRRCGARRAKLLRETRGGGIVKGADDLIMGGQSRFRHAIGDHLGVA